MILPRTIHQLWVGPKPPPMQWINSWKNKHPAWQHRLWGEKELKEHFFVNQRHIDYYWERKIWHGVADVSMYEIMYHYGGFYIGADSECLRPVDELFQNDDIDAYCVYENEIAAPGLITPMTACKPKSKFALALVQGLSAKESVGEPWKTTGNRFMQETYESREWPNVRIFPSHYFNPVHHTGLRYTGPERPYGMQWWGTTKNAYEK